MKISKGVFSGMSTKEEVLNYLIMIIDDLLKDLDVHNPTYKSVFDIANNPVISTVADALSMNPGYFALPVNDGYSVKFDVNKIMAARYELVEIKENETTVEY